jgi:hypothetical protein
MQNNFLIVGGINMPKNKEFLVTGIKNLLKTNYLVDTDLIDVEAEVDATLEFGENWNIIKKKYHLCSEKKMMEKVKSQKHG